MEKNSNTGLLNEPLPLINEPEGQHVPDSLPFIVDAHVHLFPSYLFAPIWQWFEKFGWPIRYQLSSEDIIKFLLSHGIGHIVALHYAHKAGLARELNAYMADLCRFHHELCRADKLEQVLNEYPQLSVCVPHLGADEFEPYRRMIEKYDNLWLDTTMMLAEYLPMDFIPDLAKFRNDRIMYGTDFPNLPYAWDREIKRLTRQNLSPDSLAKFLGQNAVEFYQIRF
jgi:predicted TIM-barrel fold metal-dependent hydrolase